MVVPPPPRPLRRACLHLEPGQVPDRKPQPPAGPALAGHGGGPGEDRHLTRWRVEYAPARPGRGRGRRPKSLPGLPHGECGVEGRSPPVLGPTRGPQYLIQGNKVRQVHLVRVSGRLADLWKYRPKGLSALGLFNWFSFIRASSLSLKGGRHAGT